MHWLVESALCLISDLVEVTRLLAKRCCGILRLENLFIHAAKTFTHALHATLTFDGKFSSPSLGRIAQTRSLCLPFGNVAIIGRCASLAGQRACAFSGGLRFDRAGRCFN